MTAIAVFLVPLVLLGHERWRAARTGSSTVACAAPRPAFVAATHACFVCVDCRPGLRDLATDLRLILESVGRFGCATVYATAPT